MALNPPPNQTLIGNILYPMGGLSGLNSAENSEELDQKNGTL